MLYTSSGHRAETWAVKPPSSNHTVQNRHSWYYKYAQGPDEVMLIKCFDSDTANEARRTPHSAFEDPAHPNNGVAGNEGETNRSGRESIEVRALVFF